MTFSGMIWTLSISEETRSESEYDLELGTGHKVTARTGRKENKFSKKTNPVAHPENLQKFQSPS